MLIQRANSLLVYGDSGRYKTTNVGRFARYMYEKTGKPIRVISADGGGWGPIQGEIDAGIIDALRVVESETPLPLLRKLGQGYWPKGQSLSLDGLDDVSAYAVESLQSLGTMLMRYIVRSGRKISEEVVGQFIESVSAIEGGAKDEKFSAPARSHYGFVQNELLGIIANFRALPVERVLFTAGEGKGTDDMTNQLVYGPLAIGKALTDRLPYEVGDLLHFQAEAVNNKLEIRCYFKPHADAVTRVVWPAKARIQPSQLGALDKRWPMGYYPLTLEEGIEQYLEFQDQARLEEGKQLADWKQTVDAKRGAVADSKDATKS